MVVNDKRKGYKTVIPISISLMLIEWLRNIAFVQENILKNRRLIFLSFCKLALAPSSNRLFDHHWNLELSGSTVPGSTSNWRSAFNRRFAWEHFQSRCGRYQHVYRSDNDISRVLGVDFFSFVSSSVGRKMHFQISEARNRNQKWDQEFRKRNFHSTLFQWLSGQWINENPASLSQ